MGLQLDVLKKTVNVSWGGGSVFVTGDWGAFQSYAKIKKSSPTFEVMGTAGFPVSGFINGGCYRNMAPAGGEPDPLFLMVGNNGKIATEGRDNSRIGMITASRDGKNWGTVFTVRADIIDGISSADIFGVVWDEDESAFYAGGHFYRHDSDQESLASDLDKLYRSVDGFKWEQAGSKPTTESTTTGLFAEHLNNKAHLPGGVFGYHETRDDGGTVISSVLIKPETPPRIIYATKTTLAGPVPYAVPSISTKGATSAVSITITSSGDSTTKTVEVTDLDFVNCCAYADGIFVAAGGVGKPDPLDVSDGRIAVSFDKGETWEVAGNSLYQVLTVSGAPQSDMANAGL
jgi:hypothetical protein